MLVLGIILLIFLLLALLRFGLIVEYNDVGLQMWAKIGFFKFDLSGDGKVKWPKRKKKDRESKMPGDLGAFSDIFKALRNALGRFRRRLLIKELTLHYTCAGEDAAKTAMAYGGANAVMASIVPVLDRHFRIKNRDLMILADFESDTQGIYAKISVSLAVWEVFYIAFALLPIFKTTFKSSGQRANIADLQMRKDGQGNGKTATTN